MKGGKVLNRGFKGIVMELYNKNSDDKKTLYHDILLKVKNPNEITLITINEELKIDNSDYDIILKHLKEKSKKVLVKKFDSSSFMFGSNSKNFNNELQGYRELMEIFKNDVSKYTTIKKGFTYKNKDIYGISFHNNYYIFLEKCYKTLDNIDFTEKSLKKCVKDIIEILDIMNGNNYIHNDIKPDNIILCKKRFKIIDWESSNYIKDQTSTFINSKNGNLVYNHPVKFYRIGVPYTFYKYIYDAELMTYSMLNNLQKPKEIAKLVASSYNEVVSKYSKLSKIPSLLENKKKRKIQSSKFTEIKENKDFYLKLSDYYAFAIMVIYLAEKNNIDYPHKIIDKILEYYFIKNDIRIISYKRNRKNPIDKNDI